ncbi:MAG: PrsW family glutamic-type intramembrane protease [bacterium]|nr:PrsW family glutamic-type intramembrane protease [bacterium]
MAISYLVPIVLGLLPSFAWIVFFLREDKDHPEPKKLIFYTFIVGAASSFLVLPFQIFINERLIAVGTPIYGATSLFLLAAVEEIFKFAVVYWAISKRREFDEPLDAMIYMIIAALGFAAVENVASLFQVIGNLETVALRFIGATLLHSLASGLVGFYWAKAMLKKRSFASNIIWGLLLATVLHAIFNYLIINTGPVGFSIVFLVFIAYFLLNDFEVIKQAEAKQ